MGHRHHSLDYVEFTSPDVQATRDFLATALGWESRAHGPDYAGVQDPHDAGHEIAGVARGTDVPPLVVVYSEDIEATEQAVLAAGGTITRAVFEFPGGRRFHFRDPAGVELGVWTSVGSPEPHA